MLTGMLANALGWRRWEDHRLQRLQDRLVFAARIEREPVDEAPLTDLQTAWLTPEDRGWTFEGVPESRRGGAALAGTAYLQWRDYWADMQVTVVLRLHPAAEAPRLSDLEHALNHPARPLYIGRKTCLPATCLHGGAVEAPSILEALLQYPGGENPGARSLMWADDPEQPRMPTDGVLAARPIMVPDRRNWHSRLHGGRRRVWHATQPKPDDDTQENAP